ncbi:unnamed protein product (macronuclear) [Paramecium tetraurelia]|uniref:Uncharacterized protein n=1 Tax=Paramecium tetraurelia TaxID=5888 RepID=A0D247_PARTE|nr:uncharacterized protein GSPATT00012620001 [Paramecium tetraurelia]CAK77114.1 unnamed protein product [Paramecium tetraurelia]|eukprot:XP_001444511.1 hypothetical protein (macronuclear) [Paramecium tetraurelia strain d4-2]
MAFLNKFFPSFLQEMTDQIEQQEKEMEEQFLNEEPCIIQEDVIDQSQSFQIENSLVNESQQVENAENNLETPQVSIVKQDKQDLIEIDDSESFQVQNEESFDHLSIFDPEDEWLKNNQKSLIRSIATSSVESQFSNVLLLNQPSNVSLLKSRSNIFIKNNVLQQLVQKFQFFSDEFKTHIEKQTHKATLLSNRTGDEKEFDHMINFLYDLDNIDIDTIYLILDLLEQFKSYKLCIYVCNQFKLAQYIGRYLVSLASLYTPLTRTLLKDNYQIIINKLYRKQILQQAAVSQLAINNILESINPLFLQFKFEEQLNLSNSFGITCYKELIGLGYWKTVIYQLNYEHAFNLCKSFNSYSDIVNVIEKVKENRKNKLLSEQEQFNQNKYQYFIDIQDALQKKHSNFNPIFSTSIKYFDNKRQLTQDIIEDIIKNSQLQDGSNLNYTQQLKQIESIILSHLILEISATQEKKKVDLSQLVEIKIYFLNQIQLFCQNSNIIDSFSFLYQFSLPQGEIMDHYSQYTLVYLTSGLISFLHSSQKEVQKDQIQISQQELKFIDIGFEYVLTPYHVVLKAIYKSFIQSLSDQFFQLSESIKTYYLIYEKIGEKQQFPQIVYRNHFLPVFQQLYHLEQKQKNVLPIIFLPKTVNPQKFKNFNDQPIRNLEIERHSSSILNQIKSLHLLDFTKILIKTNIRNPNLPSQIKQFLINESIALLQKSQDKLSHQKVILAINMLNYVNELPLAIFTLQQMKKTILTNPYIKYMEFLECQEYNITDDLFNCFAEFSADLQNQLFLDEWLYHLIRVGLTILISILEEKKLQIYIPYIYVEFVKEVEDHKIQAPIFKIQNEELLVEYLYLLGQFLDNCNSEHYEYHANLLLIIFIINLPVLTNEVIEQIAKMIEFDSKYKFYQRLKVIILKDLQVRQNEYIKQNHSLYINHYLDLPITNLQIVNKYQQNQLEQLYNTCLQNWEQYQNTSESIKQNGQNLIRKWLQHKQFIAKQKFLQQSIPKFQLQTYIVKFQQFYSLNLKQLYKNLNNKDIKIENNIKEAFAIQEDILNQRHGAVDSIDLHFCNSLIEKLSQLNLQILKGVNVSQQLIELSNELVGWKENIKLNQDLQDELLARNKELLAIKWKNLKSGIKLKKRVVKKVEMQTIQEEEEEQQ